MPGSVVGREAELAGIEEFVDSIPAGLAVLALEGEAGIGKTTLWRAACARAAKRGFRVLASRPGSSETRLSYAALGDLVSAVPAAILSALPKPQRRALDVATVRADDGAEGPAPDQRTVCVAFLSVVRALAATAGVLLAIDDAQWLDAPTAAVLAFAVRRLEHEPVGILVAVRVTGEPASTFERAAGELRRAVRVGPLSIGALHEMLKERLGHSFLRPTLLKIERAAGGNPFYALEIARELMLVGEPQARDRIPVPDDLRKLVVAHIRRLPADTRQALLAASMLSAPTVEHVDEGALAPAEEAEIVRVGERGRIEFTHPLFASAVYSSASTVARRHLHRRLADVVDDLEERARHLALATPGPDEAVALLLEEAAAVAFARGAPSAAAELAELSVRLTPPDDATAAARRATRLASHLYTAGDTRGARKLLEATVADVPPGAPRAEALLLLGVITEEDGDRPEAIEFLRSAAEEAAGEAALLGRIHAQLAQSYDFDLTRAVMHAQIATELLADADNRVAYANALQTRANVELLSGLPPDDAAIEESLAIQQRERALHLEFDFAFVPAFWALYRDDYETARARFLEYLDAAVAVGEESMRPYLLAHLADTECQTGRWADARRHADESVVFAEQIGQRGLARFGVYVTALVHALRGDVDAALAQIARLEETIDERVDQRGRAFCLSLRAFVALSLGEHAETDRLLTRATALLEEVGMREPARHRFQADHVEAVVALGDLDRAAALLARLEERARIFPRPWNAVMAARCRGLLLAAHADLAGAEEALHEALAGHERLELPFELARTLLALGRVQRRHKERRAARETLTRSLELFESLGSPLWAEAAQAEIARVGVRRAPAELTAGELAVAELAASGLTNRDIAAKLFLSRRTVEANLARAYAKLGIRSRAELGARMAERR